jgi:hypothetical protein
VAAAFIEGRDLGVSAHPTLDGQTPMFDDVNDLVLMADRPVAQKKGKFVFRELLLIACETEFSFYTLSNPAGH